MASQAIFAGLEIGLFDVLGESDRGGLTISELNANCGITAPRLQTLVTALVSAKSLRRDGETGRYTLSPNTARFLVKSSRQYYGDYLRFQVGRQFYGRMGGLSDALISGAAPTYAEWFSDAETAATYTRAQHNGSTATARALVKKLDFLDSPGGGVGQAAGKGLRLLDVGGGSGAFSYVFAAAHPHLEATVLELPGVVAAAAPILAEQAPDVRARVRYAELDVAGGEGGRGWPTAPGTFDAVLMSYISGSVPEPAVAHIYAQAHAALKPGGRLIVHGAAVASASLCTRLSLSSAHAQSQPCSTTIFVLVGIFVSASRPFTLFDQTISPCCNRLHGRRLSRWATDCCSVGTSARYCQRRGARALSI